MTNEEIQLILDTPTEEIKICTDESIFKVNCEPIDLETGEKIALKLFDILSFQGGVALSANQIGIPYRVCVVNVNIPFHFINPLMYDGEGDIIYIEGCLSYPGKLINTRRFSTIKVQSDNNEDDLYWDLSYVKPKDVLNDKHVLEIIAVQHAISLLDGHSMYDFEYKLVPYVSEPTIGRNEKIWVTDGNSSIEIKYKRLNEYTEKGFSIVENNG